MGTCATLGVQEAAAILRAEPETVMQLARCGELPGTRIGKSWVFLEDDVIAFLRERIERDTKERAARQAQAPAAILVNRTKRKGRTVVPDLTALYSQIKEPR